MPTLKASRTVERWSVLIPKANGKGNEIYKKVERIVRENNPPEVQMENKMVSPTSALKGLLLGKKREYLVVRNEFLIAHKIFIGARDYGNQLAVSWYLVIQTGMKEFMRAKKGTPPTNANAMDPFDLEELTAYTATIHHAVLEAVEEISKDVDFDFTKVDRKSKGFLNIS